ncbi:MAG: membrane integrity-associated transporter subunit PqiC, partial [Nitrospirae bacterium]|nr:membrane integrity-associated transporter subunit PqiC [Nitrospirota bacterium]
PLKDALSLTIAENISRLLASDKVSSYPQAVSLSADYKVYVDVRLFEFAGDHVELDALWAIRLADGRPAGNGRSRQREVVTGSGYDAVVTAFSRGVAGISHDIVQGLKSGWQAGEPLGPG